MLSHLKLLKLVLVVLIRSNMKLPIFATLKFNSRFCVGTAEPFKSVFSGSLLYCISCIDSNYLAKLLAVFIIVITLYCNLGFSSQSFHYCHHQEMIYQMSNLGNLLYFYIEEICLVKSQEMLSPFMDNLI